MAGDAKGGNDHPDQHYGRYQDEDTKAHAQDDACQHAEETRSKHGLTPSSRETHAEFPPRAKPPLTMLTNDWIVGEFWRL
jgi:hypothetical protein